MKKPKFIVGYPKDKVDNATGDALQLTTFYNNLKIVLDDMGYENKFISLKYKLPPNEPNSICLGFHTRTGGRDNAWCLKGCSIFNHWDFNSMGFAGWSDVTKSKATFQKSQSVDLDQAREFFDRFSQDYIENNMSKFAQPTGARLEIDQPYIFFPGQIKADSVVKNFGKIDPQLHADQVSKQLTDSGYGVVFKPHPGGTPKRPSVHVDNPNVIQYTGSIHDIIPNANGVVVMNSGVGFESLLYKKHVFTSGICDYHWVTHNIYSVDDIKTIPEILKTPVDEEKIIKFVYYMLTEVYVDATCLNSIRKKIEMAVRVYENTP